MLRFRVETVRGSGLAIFGEPSDTNVLVKILWNSAPFNSIVK